jgi:hypothetical protein
MQSKKVKETLESVERLISFYKSRGDLATAQYWLEQHGRLRATNNLQSFPIGSLKINLVGLELHKQRSKEEAKLRQLTFFAFFK